MPIQLQRVRNLSTYDRVKFYEHLISEIRDTVYPESYNLDKAAVLEALEERKNDIIDGRA